MKRPAPVSSSIDHHFNKADDGCSARSHSSSASGPHLRYRPKVGFLIRFPHPSNITCFWSSIFMFPVNVVSNPLAPNTKTPTPPIFLDIAGSYLGTGGKAFPRLSRLILLLRNLNPPLMPPLFRSSSYPGLGSK